MENDDKNVPDASFVVPCFNEEETIPIFYKTLLGVVEPLGISFEIIFVDDGSRDASLKEMRALSEKDSRVRYVSFSRNFGKEAALLAGLDSARGNAVATMDVDLQHPPALLGEMFKALREEGFDCAGACRKTRDGEPKIRSWLSAKFYKVMAKISQTEFVPNATDFRLMSRPMIDAILSLRERNRFTKGIYSWVGFKTKWIPYENIDRSAGATKWSFLKLLVYSFDGIIAFSTTPLTIISLTGMLFALGAVVAIFATILLKLCGWSMAWGWPTLVCILFFLSGVILFCLGIIGQYLAKAYIETKHRPQYIVKETNASRER